MSLPLTRRIARAALLIATSATPWSVRPVPRAPQISRQPSWAA
ncbi:hypothetical protein SBADM41S_09927 [Streptomyces badius]